MNYCMQLSFTLNRLKIDFTNAIWYTSYYELTLPPFDFKLQGETGVVGFYKLCYRLVAQKPLDYFKKNWAWILHEKMDVPQKLVGDIFTPATYESLFTLVRHSQVPMLL